ncbi:MAG: T9SS type A sorting domain-containing protein, partial [Fulvivirga sp.]|uniref:T9SS type A sorting domain-containing protein n=1 Tax=Fulvivirga sp. TaxID=1931237 RepID=UPI0032EC4BE8
VTVDGGSYMGDNGGLDIIGGLITVRDGLFDVGSGGVIRINGDFNFEGGSFSGGSGSAQIQFRGSTLQTINGDFSGANAFHRVLFLNPSGFNFTGGNSTINSLVNFANGVENIDGGLLNLGSSTTVLPTQYGSSMSYVNGRVSRVISSGGSFNFPIGSETNWRPASVNNVSASGLTWEAEYFEGDPTSDPLVDNLTPTNSSIQTISSGEYWKISDGNGAPSGVTARVGLSWGSASDVSSVLAEREELEVMIWNDAISSWDNLDGTSFSSGHSSSSGRFVAVNSNSFSEQIFTLGSTTANNPLPVTLVSFEGMLTDETVLIKWKTSTEINNDYFELQRSANGMDYETIALIQGSGNTARQIEYDYLDTKPIAGNNYYRLKQVDFDGQVTIENKIVLVEYIPKNFTLLFNVFPNPTSEYNINVRVTANQDVPVRLELFDLFGKKVFSNEYSSSELYDDIKVQPTEQLNQGIYIIRLEQLDKSITKRLIITK